MISSSSSVTNFSSSQNTTKTRTTTKTNSSFHSMVPEISVDIPDLEDYHINSEKLPLSLTVHHEEGSSLSAINSIKSPLLDLQNIDFLGPAEVIKKLFKLPHSRDQPYFALHRMGNTILIDSILKIDEQGETEDESHQQSQPQPRPRPESHLQEQDHHHGHDQERLPNAIVFSPDRPMNSLIGNLSATTAVSNFMCGLPEPQSHMTDDTVQQGGSPYLPPPGYFFPQHPPVLPFRNIFRWQLRDLKFALGSDLLIYDPPDRPAVTVAPIDTTKEIPLITCLDHYLDNVMANVPELALCLHAKGFLRGISVCGTDDIPQLRNMLQSADNLNRSIIDEHSPLKNSMKSPKNNTKTPLFDPQVIELNALTILRFLKQNCSKENGTYIVHLTRKDSQTLSHSDSQSSPPDAIQIFDLQAMSLTGQRKWKWLLAMLSHRFATRLGHHYSLASPHSRVILRDRQLSLYQSCYDLLLQIRQLGGGNHGTIRAAVLEHIADIHKSRAETSNQNKHHHHHHHHHRGDQRNYTSQSHEQENDQEQDHEHEHGKDWRGVKKKKSKKNKQNDKSAVDFIPTCELQCSHNSTISEPEFHDDELDNIDYSFEIEKSLDLFLLAMSDLGDIMTSQILEEHPAELPEHCATSILIGDVECEAFGPLENDTSSAYTDETTSTPTPVNLMLVLQYSGLFHKTISSCMSVIKNILSSSITRYGSSKLTTAMQYLHRILPYCQQWLLVTAKIKHELIAYQRNIETTLSHDSHTPTPLTTPTTTTTNTTRTTTPDLVLENFHSFTLSETLASENNPKTILDESIQDMWSIDRTLIEDLPLFWDTLGEICHELTTLKPNKEEASDLDNFSLQLKEWRSSILTLQETCHCLTLLTIQASSRDVDSIPLNDWHISDTLVSSLWMLLSGREWNVDCNSSFLSALKSLFKFFIPLFNDTKMMSEDEVLIQSINDAEMSLSQTSIHLLKLQSYAFLIGVLLQIRNECGWCRSNWWDQIPLSTPVHLSQEKFATQVVRHLGDTCNELGQTLFRTLSTLPITTVEITNNDFNLFLNDTYKLFQEKIIKIADLANMCYVSAIEIFSGLLSNKLKVSGTTNVIAVRCNMSCLKRVLSSILCEMILKSIKGCTNGTSRNLSMYLQSTSSPLLNCSIGKKRDQHKLNYYSPLDYSIQAAELCQDALINTNSSSTLQSSGAFSILSLELATNYTFSGLLYRKCLGDYSIATILHSKDSIPNSDELIKLINLAIEYFERALSIFSDIATHPSAIKNIPVIHYHLGSLRAMLWGLEISQQKENITQQFEINLEQSMNHYSHAHTYYLKYDVGSTLLLILTEMAEMYLYSFGLREYKLIEELKVIKDDIHPSQESIRSMITLQQVVSSLLGGAFRVLIDCRFALTGIVLERHGQSMIESGLINTITNLFKILLLKLLKYLSTRAYGDNSQQQLERENNRRNGVGNNKHLNQNENQMQAIQLLKEIYSELFKTTEWFYHPVLSTSSSSSSSTATASTATTKSSLKNGVSQIDDPNNNSQRRDVRQLYEMLDKLNSCEWLKSNILQ